MKNLLKKVFKHWELFLVIFLILEFVIFGAANPKFLRPKSIMNSIVKQSRNYNSDHSNKNTKYKSDRSMLCNVRSNLLQFRNS